MWLLIHYPQSRRLSEHLLRQVVPYLLVILSSVSVVCAQSFAPAVNYPVSSSPQGVTVADFDRDGKLDVVSVNSAGTISFMGGNGDGTFKVPVDYATGPLPRAVTK